MKELYEMELHDHLSVEIAGMPTGIIRVPGGWHYIYIGSRDSIVTFVPLNKEFQEKQKKESKKNELWQPDEWLCLDAWDDFEAHRKSLRKPLSNLARSKASKVLRALTYQEQRDTINKSIQAGWAGLFPDKALGANFKSVKDEFFDD